MIVRVPTPGSIFGPTLPANYGDSIEVFVLSASPNVLMPLVATALVWEAAAYVFPVTSYTFAPASDTVTIVQAGRYTFTWSIGLLANVLTASTDCISQLEQAAVLDADGFAIASTEEFFTNANSMERTITRDVSAGSAIRILANQFGGGGTCDMVTGQMSLAIERVI